MSDQAASPSLPSFARRARNALTPRERRSAGALAGAVVALHAIGFGLLLTGAFGVGLGLTAYLLGIRHAFDADHVAAIDNVTRKLMAEGRRPVSVGFWFSLGHATVVFALVALVVLGVHGAGGAVRDDGSWLHEAAGVVGPLVSGSFLLAIGLVNLALLVGMVGRLRRLRPGAVEQPALGGALSRLCARATRAVRHPWQTYPLGLLFGLGFDTATEVALLVLAGGAVLGGLPFSTILCLPVLFAAGMTLFDTLDGAFMRFAYGWALARPARRAYYNLTVTGLSVAVALLVGAAELLSALAARLGLHGGAWSFVATLDLNTIGYAVVGLFVATWALALAVWRFGRVEERWAARLGETAG